MALHRHERSLLKPIASRLSRKAKTDLDGLSCKAGAAPTIGAIVPEAAERSQKALLHSSWKTTPAKLVE